HHHGGAAELERDAHHVERVDMVVDDKNSQAGKVHVQTCPAQAVGIGEKESRAEFANATAESGGESFTYTKSRDRASVDAASRRAKSMVGELVEERTVADAQELGGVEAVPPGALQGGGEHGALGFAGVRPGHLLESAHLGVGGAHRSRAVEVPPSSD